MNGCRALTTGFLFITMELTQAQRTIKTNDGVNLMKISTKGRYGIVAMLDLALNGTEETHVPLNHIAERQQISLSYLEQMFSRLRKAGYVKSTKGPQGGYRLSDKPSHITAGDILRTLEGNVEVVEKSRQGIQNPYETCLYEHVWQPINRSINNTMDSITLEDLMEAFQRQEKGEVLMFYI